jgi:hypothetical protein
MRKRQNFLSKGQVSASLLSSFVKGLYDYFNPLLKVLEELQRDAKKNRHK